MVLLFLTLVRDLLVCDDDMAEAIKSGKVKNTLQISLMQRQLIWMA